MGWRRLNAPCRCPPTRGLGLWWKVKGMKGRHLVPPDALCCLFCFPLINDSALMRRSPRTLLEKPAPGGRAGPQPCALPHQRGAGGQRCDVLWAPRFHQNPFPVRRVQASPGSPGLAAPMGPGPQNAPRVCSQGSFPRSVPARVGSGDLSANSAACLLPLLARPWPLSSRLSPVPALLLSLAGRNTGLRGTQFGAGPSLPPPRPWETCLALAEEEVAAAVEHVAVASPEASVLFSLCAFVMPRPEEATARLRALEGPTRHPERPKHAFPGGSYATPAVSDALGVAAASASLP